MAQTVLIDEGTARAIEELKRQLGVDTDIEAIRRAIALTKVAFRQANSNFEVTMSGTGMPAQTSLDINLKR